LRPVVYIDLFGCAEAAARERVLTGLAVGRSKPLTKPRYPGEAARRFPGAPQPGGQAETATDKLFYLPLETIPEPSPLPPGSLIPLAPNPSFVGRENELRNLVQLLKVGAVATVTASGNVAAATGLGGLGKTQLAAEFAHRYGRFFEGGVFWLSFANAET